MNKAQIEKNIALLNLLVNGPHPMIGLSRDSDAFKKAFECVSNPGEKVKIDKMEELWNVEEILNEIGVIVSISKVNKAYYIVTI